MSMTPERWRLIDSIFNEAADLPEAEREEFVRSAAKGDAEIIQEVRSLLSADATKGLSLDDIVSDAVERADHQQTAGDIGLVLGPYKLTGLIGSGGMGSVYKAVRADQTFTQAVAIKLVRRGMDSDFILGRFRQERQILGNLNHPNIARILDAGSAADGRPYFVMEYIEGLPLLNHARERSLSVAQRLELFLQVCAAVQHAHQKLIIHRDLKPSNILVTADGIPKLLDFGIAKILTPTDATGEVATLTTSRMMTPDYASPEQVMGLELTTATDVYSLGALLYELLAETKPYRIASRSLSEMERAICTVDPKRPSAAASDPKLRKELAGDLDNIVLHAMNKEIERRYPSPDHLAADIRNYLQGRPVSAREITFLYRAGKTIRRNKTASIAAALLLVTLMGGVLSTYYQARRAERRFTQVRKLANTFLFDFYEAIERTPGTVEARALVLRTAREYLDSLAAEAHGDDSLSLELAQAYLRLGDVEGGVLSGNLGNSKLALSHFRKAQALVEPMRIDGHSVTVLATVYRRLGDLESYSSDLPGAMGHYLKAAKLLETHGGSDTDTLLLLASLYSSAARMQARMLKSAEADENARKAAQIYEQILEREPGKAEVLNALGSVYTTLGTNLHRAQQLPQALEMHRKVIALREELVRKNPKLPEYKRDLAIAYANAADVLGSPSGPSIGDRTGALELARKMAALTEANLAADPADRRAVFDHAMALSRLGNLLPPSSGNEGIDHFRRALQMFEQIASADPNNRRARSMASFVHGRMGNWHEEAGNRAAAIAEFEKASSMAEVALAEDPNDFERILSYVAAKRMLGSARARAGNCAEGLRILQDLLQRLPEFVSRNPNQIRVLTFKPEFLKDLGDAQANCGSHAAARESYTQSVQAWQALQTHKDFNKVHEDAKRSAEEALRRETR